MTIFRTYFKVMKKYSAMLILYTVILVIFAAANMKTGGSTAGFSAEKPDIAVVNQDEGSALSAGLLAYLDENAAVREEKEAGEALSDALFYRDVSYIITIPEDFEKLLLAGDLPEIEVQSVGDYEAAYAEMLLETWIQTAQLYCGQANTAAGLASGIETAAQADDGGESATAAASETQTDNGSGTVQTGVLSAGEIADKTNETLAKQARVELTTSLDTDALALAKFFFNFLNYSLLAGCVYVIAVILSSFREEHVQRRASVSAMHYRKQNGQLLLANAVFALVLWVLYMVLALILLKDALLSAHGLCYLLNSFVFAACALSIGFLIGNLTTNKGALSGIINVVALGSSFLCGSFVPVEWLPDWVLAAAHVLPSYWFIQNNEEIAHLETFDLVSLRPLLARGAVVIAFTLLFILCTNLITRKKRVAFLLTK